MKYPDCIWTKLHVHKLAILEILLADVGDIKPVLRVLAVVLA